MGRSHFHLYLVSDTSEERWIAASRAASALYPDVSAIEHVYPHVRTRDQLSRVVADLEREPGIVLHALTDPKMTGELEERCRTVGCPSLSALKLASDGNAAAPNSAYGSMISLQLKGKSGFRFRLAAGIFAGVLGTLALWLLSVDLIRPTLPFFPADAAATRAAAAYRDRTGAAASLGVVRGDLFTDYAMTLAPELLGGGGYGGAAAAPEGGELAQAVAARAVRFAPHDARGWLLLAAAALRLDPHDHQVAGALRMSYYTGPNELALIPWRILIATRSDAITDSELQSLVSREIRTILTREPDLKPSILIAYRDASPEGKRFIEATLHELDPALSTAISTMNQAR